MGAEKRKAERIPFTVNVTYRVADQERNDDYQVQSVNIGEGGIFLKTDLPLGIGTQVRFEFTLPGDDRLLQYQGEVVWAGSIDQKGEGRVTGKGIEFTACDEQCRRILSDYMAGEAKKGERG